MKTVMTTIKKVRKNIDLNESITQTLSLQAVECNMSLKHYIEVMLERLSEMREDEILFALSQTANAQTPMNGEELNAFEKELAKYR
jgi:hypothetical protein